MILSLNPNAPDRRLLDEGRRTRAMTWIMAIMLFLTVLAGALGLGMFAATSQLDRELSGRLTVQIVEPVASLRDAQAAAMVRELGRLPGVARVREVDRAHLAELLRPWLGDAGLDPDLPMPAMIDVEVRGGDAGRGRAGGAADRTGRAGRSPCAMAVAGARLPVVDELAGGEPDAADRGRDRGGGAARGARGAGHAPRHDRSAPHAGLHRHPDRAPVPAAHRFRHAAGRARSARRRALVLVWFLQARLSAIGSEMLGGVALQRHDWFLLLLLPLGFALLATVAARVAVLRALGKRL